MVAPQMKFNGPAAGLLLGSAIAIAAPANDAQAGIVRPDGPYIHYDGTVTESAIGGLTAGMEADADIYVLNPELFPDLNGDDAFGQYNIGSSNFLIFWTIDGQEFTATGGSLFIGNDIFGGDLDVFNGGSSINDLSSLSDTAFSWGSQGSGVFDTDELTSLLDADFDSLDDNVVFDLNRYGDMGKLNGNFSIVPAPATTALLLGAAGLAAPRRRM